MARPQQNYAPENCNYGGFKILPEGEHEMIIESAFFKSGNKGPQWEIHLQPMAESLKSKFPVKCWISESFVVNAIHDAAGMDTGNIEDREYTPDEFIGKQIRVEIYHSKGDKDGKIFANVKRFCPVFTRGGKSAPQGRVERVEVSKEDVPF